MFFWGVSSEERKIAWVAWENVLAHFKNENLGIGSLDDKALWCKVIKSVHNFERGLNISRLSPRGPWTQVINLQKDLQDSNINLPSLFKNN